MNQIIEYKNIGKSYQGKWVVRDCNLTINEGDFLCIVGTSGSGKTTLLKMINGLIAPDEGDITIFGTRVIEDWLCYSRGWTVPPYDGSRKYWVCA